MRRLADRISRIRAEKEAEAIASYEEAVRRTLEVEWRVRRLS